MVDGLQGWQRQKVLFEVAEVVDAVVPWLGRLGFSFFGIGCWVSDWP